MSYLGEYLRVGCIRRTSRCQHQLLIIDQLFYFLFISNITPTFSIQQSEVTTAVVFSYKQTVTRHLPPLGAADNVEFFSITNIISQDGARPALFQNSCVVLCIVLYRSMYCLCANVYCTVLYFTLLYCTFLYCTLLYCTLLYCTVLYCALLQCTVLYCTVL